MARKSTGPWWWKQRQTWCATINNQRIELTKGLDSKPEAEREWHRLMSVADAAAETTPAATIPVRTIVNLFLEQAEARVAADTFSFYKANLCSFEEKFGKLQGAAVRPYHVDQWIDSKQWGQNTRRSAITCMVMLFRWAKRKGYLDTNPLADVDKPRSVRREEIVSPEDAAKILGAIREKVFKDFILAIWGTGCRPGEAAKVTAKEIDFERAVWVIRGKTTAKTGQMRKVFMPPPIATLCLELSKLHPAGPIFRNRMGRPWHRSAYAKRMQRLRVKLGMGKGAVCYSFRHLFATDAEEAGVAPATVAALLGHSSVAQLWTYSKLRNRDDHLKDAAEKVRGKIIGNSPSEGEGSVSAASTPPLPLPAAQNAETPGKPRRPKA